MEKKGIPVILLTGYLGAGKTTVMTHLLKDQDNRKMALIVNDMASINIDADILRNQTPSQTSRKMVELQNGCICCTLKDEFMDQIELLSKEKDLDAILVEASGISNPAAIADGFLAYQEIHGAGSVYLSSIITVVDAQRMWNEFLMQLEEINVREEEPGEDSQDDEPDIINLIMDQIEFCNIILLNKSDLLKESQLKRLKEVIKLIQPEAEIIETSYGKVNREKLLAGNLFDYNKVNLSSSIQKALLREEKQDRIKTDYGVTSFVFEDRRPFSYERFMSFLENDYPKEVVRAKGYVWFQDDDMHVQLFEQSGQNASLSEVSNWVASLNEKEKKEVFENYPEVLRDWDETYGDRMNQIVFIGQDYDQKEIQKQLYLCIKKK